MTFTVREIASEIMRDGESLIVAVDRLRNWTDEGVLSPVNKHPGTGRARQYAYSELDKAKLVEMLSRLGVPVTGRQSVRFVNRIQSSPKLQDAVRQLLRALEE